MPPVREVPAELNYDRWLGHTPVVPYMPERVHQFWRWVSTTGGGEITDRGAHVLDLVQMYLGADGTTQSSIRLKVNATPVRYTMSSSTTNSPTFTPTDCKSSVVPTVPAAFASKAPTAAVCACPRRQTRSQDPKILETDPQTFELTIGRSPDIIAIFWTAFARDSNDCQPPSRSHDRYHVPHQQHRHAAWSRTGVGPLERTVQ